MKKLIRLLIAAAATVAILAAALIVLLLNPPGAETEKTVLADHAATDIVSVEITNEAGTFQVHARDGGYLIDDIPSELIDIDAFINFMVACSDVTTLRRVERSEANASNFGFDAPLATVRATYGDGTELNLRLGAKEPLSGDYYCMADTEKGVYLLSADTAANYLIAKQALISFYVTPKLAVSSALSALQDVTFSGGPLEHPVTIESVSAGSDEVKQLAKSFGAATHIVRGAGVFELDQTYGLTVMEPLCGMTAQAIVAYGLTPEQESAMGFDTPYMQVEFDYKNGAETATHYVLRFLPAVEDGSMFYANAKNSGVVYIVERKAFFDITYEKLLLRWFLSPMLMDVSGVTVEDGGRSYTFTVDNTDRKNPVVTMNGSELDADRFRTFFRLIESAANDGVYLGMLAPSEQTPAMTITYHYGEGKPDDVMTLYSGAARRVNVYVNGVCEFAMKDSFVARVHEALQALQSGAEFDTNW